MKRGRLSWLLLWRRKEVSRLLGVDGVSRSTASRRRSRLGDQLLFAGTEEARRDLGMTLFNGHTLQFVLTGRDLPGGMIWEWLAQRREARG